MERIERHLDPLVASIDATKVNSETPGENLHAKKPLSRRDFLKVSGILGGGTVLATACKPIQEILTSRESEATLPIRFGFNTHMSANPSEVENLTPEVLREDVNRMVENGMSILRLNVWEWELDERSLEIYKEALGYAKGRGLEIHLVTNVPQLSPNGSDIEGDLEKTKVYYERMTTKFQGLVDVWQFFNEADDHNTWNYGRIENNQVYPQGYLENFGRLVSKANETVKRIDPNARTTVNVSIWNNPNGDQWIDGSGNLTPRFEEVGLFDAACGFEPGAPVETICSTIDFISLDIYFDTDYSAIEKLPELIRYFRERYEKPVVVSEVGIPTGGDGRFTPADQARSISRIIDVLQAGDVRPDAVLLYEMRDEYMRAETDPEGHFGFTDYQGNPKEGFNQVLEAIRQDEGLNR